MQSEREDGRTKIIGAQNARMLVKNQWRTKTTMRVFFVSVHVCDRIAMAALEALVGVQVLFRQAIGAKRSPYSEGLVLSMDAQDQRRDSGRMVRARMGGTSFDQATRRATVEANSSGDTTEAPSLSVSETHVVVFDVNRAHFAPARRARSMTTGQHARHTCR